MKKKMLTYDQSVCNTYQVYHKIGILSTGAYFSKLPARMGAYFHGVLINACNFLIACSCVGMN